MRCSKALISLVIFALTIVGFCEDAQTLDAQLPEDDVCNAGDTASDCSLHLRQLRGQVIPAQEEDEAPSMLEGQVAAEDSDEYNRNLQNAKRNTEKALRSVNHMYGERQKTRVVRDIDMAIKDTRRIRKCKSLMHEARMHLKEARTELRSRGKVSENKRMARNHLKKARKHLNHCHAAWLLQDLAEDSVDEQDKEADELEGDAQTVEPSIIEETDSGEPALVEESDSEEWANRNLQNAKRNTERALQKVNHMYGEREKTQVVRDIDMAIKDTRRLHKCSSLMHEARMHLKEARTELRSRGKVSENKRMARNHLKKARQHLNHCHAALLLQDDGSETLDEDDVADNDFEDQDMLEAN